MDQELLLTGTDVFAVRSLIGLSQESASEALGAAKKTVFNWEQREGGPLPDRAQLRFATGAARLISEAGLWDVVQPRLLDKFRYALGSALGGGEDVEELYTAVNDEHVKREREKVGWSDPGPGFGSVIDQLPALLDLAEWAEREGLESRITHNLSTVVLDIVSETGMLGLITNAPIDDRAQIILDAISRAGVIAQRASAERRPSRNPNFRLISPIYPGPISSNGEL